MPGSYIGAHLLLLFLISVNFFWVNFVSANNIRRSGTTSIPEALRMAPGVEVARIGTDKWIINIITKKAHDTQSILFTAGGGSFERGFVGARYGGKINEDAAYRAYAKEFTWDNMEKHPRNLCGSTIAFLINKLSSISCQFYL